MNKEREVSAFTDSLCHLSLRYLSEKGDEVTVQIESHTSNTSWDKELEKATY